MKHNSLSWRFKELNIISPLPEKRPFSEIRSPPPKKKAILGGLKQPFRLCCDALKVFISHKKICERFPQKTMS